MAQQDFRTQLSSTPLYNTKAVAQETGVPADTFRAWERRYGVPRPHRTDGGHRLYSERDIATIRWLRDRTAEGLTISQAIALMSSEVSARITPSETPSSIEAHGWERMNQQLLESLIDFDEKHADRVMSEAFAIYPMDEVFLRLVQPTMAEIGEMWHQGKLSVTVEHFATQFVRRKLSSILNTYAINEGRGLILVGCAPGELHDLGALLMAVVLVRHGWQVVYLGPQVPIKDLVDTIERLKPDMVCMSATSMETAIELVDVGRAIADLPAPAPRFGFGGRAFNINPTLAGKVPGTFLGETTQDAIDAINGVINTPNR